MPANKGEQKLFSTLIIELAKIGYVTIKNSVVELSVDGRLLVMDEFYDSIYKLLESLDFEAAPVFTELEGDSLKVTGNDSSFILNVIYC